MLCLDNRIRGKSMHVTGISRQQFSKFASRGFHGQMTLTGQGLVLGAGTLLAKLDHKAVPTEAEQERLWALLSVAYGRAVPLAVLASLRRVAKHWRGGDKSLAGIQVAQKGLPDIGEDAAYRLSLAAELLDAGAAPRELARELGFDPPADLLKYNYNPDEARVPAGSGYGSGEWTNGGCRGIAADRGEVGRSVAEVKRSEFRQSQRSTRPSQGCHRRHAAGRHDHRRPPQGSSWLRHGQISRMSMRLENKYPTNRHGSSYLQQKPRLSNLERMIFSGIKQRTLRSLNMLTPPITPSASIWLAPVTENGNRSRLPKPMAISDHQINMTLKGCCPNSAVGCPNLRKLVS